MEGLDAQERAVVETVRDFVAREVIPVARELEHTDTYPEHLIEGLKAMGVFGLAIPEPWGGARGQHTLLCPGRWRPDIAS